MFILGLKVLYYRFYRSCLIFQWVVWYFVLSLNLLFSLSCLRLLVFHLNRLFLSFVTCLRSGLSFLKSTLFTFMSFRVVSLSSINVAHLYDFGLKFWVTYQSYPILVTWTPIQWDRLFVSFMWLFFTCIRIPWCILIGFLDY